MAKQNFKGRIGQDAAEIAAFKAESESLAVEFHAEETHDQVLENLWNVEASIPEAYPQLGYGLV